MICLSPYEHPTRGPLPCGKCVACLKRRQDDWVVRLSHELEVSTSAYFVTLTYRESNVPRSVDSRPFIKQFISDREKKMNIPNPTYGQSFNVLCRRDAQLFIKRLRKFIEPYKIRYFLCGEYGSRTFRPHYHAIIFNFPDAFDVSESISKKWSHGFVTVTSVTSPRIRYVAKYCSCGYNLDSFRSLKEFRPFVLCSKRPAIGSSFLSDERIDFHRRNLTTEFTNIDGSKSRLPRFYKDKIFDDDMKAHLHDEALGYIDSLNEKYKDSSSAHSIQIGEREDAIRRLSDILFKNKSKIDSL